MLIITVEPLFHSVVKGDVSIFFGFGDVCLPDTLLGNPFGEDVGHELRWICNSEGEFGVIPHHGGFMLPKKVVNRMPASRQKAYKFLRGLFSEDCGDLPHPVRTVVEKEKGAAL